MSQSRQLAAIMFTDIVGYTALMGNDEQHAFTLLNKNRQLQKPIIGAFDGRWIKEIGDGTMASFNTVSDAVNAAIKIQEACNAASDFQLRIGIHQGEVVFENEDVFGDAVNIAARVQAAARPGCIFISETVNHNIANKKDIKTQFIKEEILKNVSQPVKMYQVLTSGSEVITSDPSGKVSLPVVGNKIIHPANRTWKLVSIIAIIAALSLAAYFLFQRKPAYDPGETERSIAVLPFVNMSNDAEQEFFSDGISEEIINVLAQVPLLKVTGRTSSFAFKGKNQDLKFIGEQLKVSHILEGSVRKSGNKLRITAQLINVADGYHLYSETFDRELKDVFSIQDEISLAILSAIKIKLLGPNKEAVLKRYTDNVEAYQLYLKARYAYNKYTPDSFMQAVAYLDEAIKIEPEYAIAYSTLSYCYLTLWYWNWMPAEKSLAKGLAAAKQSLRMDPEIAESHLAMGRVLLHYELKISEAVVEYKKSLAINPNSAECHVQLAVCATHLGKYAEAKEHASKADGLDPFSLMNLWFIGAIYSMAGDDEKVLEYGKRLVDLEPNFAGGHSLVGSAHLAAGRLEEGFAELELTVSLNPDLWNLCKLAWAYGMTGEKMKAKAVIEKMKGIEGAQISGNSYFGLTHVAIGELETAFEYFDKAMDGHEGNMMVVRAYLSGVPEFMEDPRAKALWKRLGLPNE